MEKRREEWYTLFERRRRGFMKETKIQWHSAFVSAIGLDLEKNRADLILSTI